MSAAERARARLAPLGPAEVLVTGLYAWGATVAAPARAAGPAAIATSALAVAALLAAVPLVRRRPALARALGIHAFVALSLATWAQLGPAAWARLDRFQGALGALAWALWTVGWGVVDRPRGDAAGAGSAAPLARRAAPSRVPGAVLALASLGALALVALAWTLVAGDRALFAHAAAIACATASLAAGARVAISVGQVRPARSGRERLAASAPALALAVALAVAALASALVR